MPQLSTLILKDRAATPANHTFFPRDIIAGVATVHKAATVPMGDKRVQISSKRTTSGRHKVNVKYTFPVLAEEVINGVPRPTVLRTSYVEMSFNYDQSSTGAERNDIVGMVQSSLDTTATLLNDTIVNLQGIY